MSFRKSLVLLFSEKTDFPFGQIINMIINAIITFFLTLDIILKFKTSYYEKGMMINSEKKIVFHYFKKDFLVDTLSILPLYFELFLRIEEIENENFIIFFICLQSLVFLKIPEVNHFLKYFHEIFHLNDNQLAIFQLAELILSIFFFCHLMACGWHAISFYSPYQASILKTSNYKSDDWLSRYFTCLFFTANSGKIDPKNDSEFLYAFFAILSTSTSIGFMVGGIHNIMRILSKTGDSKRQNKKYLRFFNII